MCSRTKLLGVLNPPKLIFTALSCLVFLQLLNLNTLKIQISRISTIEEQYARMVTLRAFRLLCKLFHWNC